MRTINLTISVILLAFGLSQAQPCGSAIVGPLTGPDPACVGVPTEYGINFQTQFYNVYWWTNSGTLSLQGQFSTFVAWDYPGTHVLNVSYECFSNPGITYTMSSTFQAVAGPSVDLGPDTTLTAGDSILLNPIVGGVANSYLWQDGSVDSTLMIYCPGTYRVAVWDSSCPGWDTIVVFADSTWPMLALSGDSLLCPGDTATISVPGGGFSSYLWSNADTTASIHPTSPGTYSVEVLDTLGCPSTDTAILAGIQVNQPYFTDTVLCLGGEVVLSGGLGIDIVAWSTGSTADTLVIDTIGNYWVDMLVDSLCPVRDNFVVTAVGLPVFSLVPDSGGCGPWSMNGPPGMADYFWSTGDTTDSIAVYQPGVYWLQVTTHQNCTYVDSVNITILPTPNINLGPDRLVCDSVTLFGPPGMNSYLWSNGDTTSSIYVDSSGTYWLTASTASCTVTDSVVLTLAASPVFSLGPDTTFCFGLTYQGPSGPFTYLWSSGSTSQYFAPDSSGIFWGTVTSASGCATTDSVSVIVNPKPTNFLPNNIIICGPGPVVAPPGYVTYLWSGTPGNTDTVFVSTTGTYSLAVIDSNGCYGIDNVYIAIASPAIFSLGPDATVCDSVQLSGPANMTSYLWSTGDTTPTISAATSGTYWLEVNNFYCDSRDSIDLTVLAGPNFSLGPDRTFCGSEALSAPSGINSFIWSTSDTTPGISVVNTGVYWLQVSDSNNCTLTDSVVLTATASTAFTLGGDTTICEPLLLSGPPGMTDYLWSNGDTSATTQVSISGSYWLEVSDSGNCNGSDTVLVTFAAAPVFSLGADTSSCDSILLAGPPGMSSYLWSNGDTTVGTSFANSGAYWLQIADNNNCSVNDTVALTVLAATAFSLGADTSACDSILLNGPPGMASYLWSNGDTTVGTTSSLSGAYWLQIGDSNSCLTSDTVGIIVLTAPAFSLGADTTTCDSILLNGPPGMVSYLWSNGDTTVSTSSSTSGIYWLQIGDFYSCMTSDTVAITVLPVPAFSLGADTTSCDSILLNGPPGMASYLWSTAANSSSIWTQTSGTYWLEVADSNSCSSSDSINLVLNSASPFVLGPDTTVCDTFLLTGPLGMSGYLWSNGDTTANTILTASGNYWLTVSDSLGCNASDSILLLSGVSNSVAITPAGPIVLQAGGSVVLDAGGGFGSYLWSHGPTTQTVTIANSGSYTVTVTDSLGCQHVSDTVWVNVLLNGRENSPSIQARIYPNPSHGEVLMLETDPAWVGLGATWEIYNGLGQPVHSAQNIDQVLTELPVSQLPAGNYFVLLRLGDEVQMLKLLRMRE